MNRRTFLFGVTSAVGGGTMALGTSAFSSTSLSRGVTVEIAPDDQAYLALKPGTSGGIIRINENGTFTVDPEAVDGDGLNPNSTYKFGTWNESDLEIVKPAFQIINQGTEEQIIEITYDWNPDEIGASIMTWIFNGPAENNQFVADKDHSTAKITIPTVGVGDSIDVAFRIDAADLNDNLSGNFAVSSQVTE